MKKIFFIGIGLMLTTLSFGQIANPELVSSSGDSFSNTTYQLDWSIGECVTATHNAGSYVITQGFHQDKYVITGIENPEGVTIDIAVFPNPTTDQISVKLNSLEIEHLEYILTDISGTLLQTIIVKSDIEKLNFSTYTSGVYFLTVKQGNLPIKSFKIIKY